MQCNVTATVDHLEQVRAMRACFAARSRQAERQPSGERVPRIEARGFSVGTPVIPPAVGTSASGGGGGGGGKKRKAEGGTSAAVTLAQPTAPISARIHTPEEEIGLGPACYLWDYLRRSGGGGYFLPLSGGADSSSTAAIVGLMCQQVLLPPPSVAAGETPPPSFQVAVLIRLGGYAPSPSPPPRRRSWRRWRRATRACWRTCAG